MKRLIAICMAVLFVMSVPLKSQEVTKVGTTAAGFLNIDIGARAIGMGGAYVAVSDDIMSMYWNVAGISRIDGAEATFTYNKWLADIYMLARIHLQSIGVTHFYGGEYCTYSDTLRFFSYRRDGVTGRMASLIWLDSQG